MIGRLEDLSGILFGGDTEALNQNTTQIIYGTALTDSVNGEVTVALDDAIFSLDDAEDDYEYISLSDADDDTIATQEEEEPDDDEEIVYWDENEDEAVEEDE